jgi:hypothetical protein
MSMVWKYHSGNFLKISLLILKISAVKFLTQDPYVYKINIQAL